MASIFDNLIGEEGLQAELTVTLEDKVYIYLALVVIVSIVVGSLLSSIAKDVLVKS